MQLLTASVQQLQPSTLSMNGCPVHFCAAHYAHALFLSASGTFLTRRRQPVQNGGKRLQSPPLMRKYLGWKGLGPSRHGPSSLKSTPVLGDAFGCP